jgi:hypothetical protein
LNEHSRFPVLELIAKLDVRKCGLSAKAAGTASAAVANAAARTTRMRRIRKNLL